jgi:ER-bound oxygenase mpaB/B'/Rubber oxygenase, catalytic domain
MIEKIDLSNYRTIGDIPADNLINEFVETFGIQYLRQLIPFLSDYQSLSFSEQPQILQDFFEKNRAFPIAHNRKKLIRATDYYQQNQQNIGLVLGLYSLPYCYLGADGVKVLCMSARIKNDTYKRLLETGNFLKAAMNFDNWENGQIFSICLKVRLLHAAIRYFTLKSEKWDMAWGYPINQEDMLGTNLAFSLIVLRGMEKLGQKAENEYETAYIQTWNVIGVLLGLNPELLPQNYSDAIKLDKLIAQRQFRSSMEGAELCGALLQVVRAFAPNEFTADLMQEQSRFLLGQKYAEMLEIKETNVPKSLLKIYNVTSALVSNFVK